MMVVDGQALPRLGPQSLHRVHGRPIGLQIDDAPPPARRHRRPCGQRHAGADRPAGEVDPLVRRGVVAFGVEAAAEGDALVGDDRPFRDHRRQGAGQALGCRGAARGLGARAARRDGRRRGAQLVRQRFQRRQHILFGAAQRHLPRTGGGMQRRPTGIAEEADRQAGSDADDGVEARQRRYRLRHRIGHAFEGHAALATGDEGVGHLGHRRNAGGGHDALRDPLRRLRQRRAAEQEQHALPLAQGARGFSHRMRIRRRGGGGRQRRAHHPALLPAGVGGQDERGDAARGACCLGGGDSGGRADFGGAAAAAYPVRDAPGPALGIGGEGASKGRCQVAWSPTQLTMPDRARRALCRLARPLARPGPQCSRVAAGLRARRKYPSAMPVTTFSCRPRMQRIPGCGRGRRRNASRSCRGWRSRCRYLRRGRVRTRLSAPFTRVLLVRVRPARRRAGRGGAGGAGRHTRAAARGGQGMPPAWALRPRIVRPTPLCCRNVGG